MKAIRLSGVLLAVFSGFAMGGTVYTSDSSASSAELVSSSGNSVTVRFILPELSGTEAMTDEFGRGTVFRIPGEGIGGRAGYPDLPVVRRMVRVPDTGSIELSLGEIRSAPLGNYRIPPFQPLPIRGQHDTRFAMDTETYCGGIYPPSPVVIESVEILRDMRVAWVSFYPVRWDPGTGEAILTTEAEITLTANPEPGENELFKVSSGITGSFLPLYDSVLGFEHPGNTVNGSYVFISSQEGLDQVQPLIDWKHRKGYEVETVTLAETGSTPEEIDTWIENAFSTWPNPPEYILLVGDASVVPSPDYNGHAADNIYGVVGSGCVPSIHVGRLSGSDTDDLRYEAWKIVMHETEPYEPAVSWFQKGISVGHTEFTANSWDYVEYMMAAGMTATWFCDNGGIPPTVAGLSDSLNSGCSLFGLCGHGNMTSISPTGFDIDDISALSNGRRLGWWVLVACQTGMFDQGYCFSEALMGEGDTLDVKGAIGVMSPTTNSPYGAADSLAKWIFKGYLQEDIRHMGAVTDWSKAEVFAYYGSSAIDNNHMHMVFGCPEMDMYTDTAPLPMISCDHPVPVTPGTHTFTVSSQGSPVEGVLVAVKVYDPAGSCWMESGYSDASGSVQFTVPSFSPGSSVYVTATGFNLYPYLYDTETSLEGHNWTTVNSVGLYAGPSPCRSALSIDLSLPREGHVMLTVFDLCGRAVAVPFEGLLQPGSHSIAWNLRDRTGSPIPPGLYFCRLESEWSTRRRSFVVVR
ncbi:MAG TPA: C25 family cysteine peptidase [Candidatus Sabulitectum sp.]|nr:C25 family cysteine peptidase [Candidatus Sabulitectum sp.]